MPVINNNLMKKLLQGCDRLLTVKAELTTTAA